MKKIIYIILITVVLLPFVNSCTNLDEKVYNQVAVKDFGKTKTEQDALVGLMYTGLQTYVLNDPSYLSLVEISGGMALIPRRGGDWWDNGAHSELTLHTWTPSSAMVNYGYILTGGLDWGFWYSAYHN